MNEKAPLPKIEVSTESPLHTTDFREHQVFKSADANGQVPDVSLGSAQLNPRDRPRPHTLRIGIGDSSGSTVGAFNLIQKNERTWINDVRIDEAYQGKKLAIASYLGVIAALQAVGRSLESDPSGLSEDSVKVWESLARRGVAEMVEDSFDQHGHPRFVTSPPTERT